MGSSRQSKVLALYLSEASTDSTLASAKNKLQHRNVNAKEEAAEVRTSILQHAVHPVAVTQAVERPT